MTMLDTDFQADLQRAAAVAQRSPSSHNCQPWAVGQLRGTAVRRQAAEQVGDSGPVLLLALDKARELTALPAHRQEMLLSCGIYWHLLLRALAGLGWRRRRESGPLGHARLAGMPATWQPLTMACFEPCQPDPDGLAALAELAGRRHTNRGAYAPEPVDAALATLPAEARGPVRFWTDFGSRQLVASLMMHEGSRDFAHRAAWRETHSYLSVDDAAARRRGEGFSINQLVGGRPPVPARLAHAALNPMAMRLLGRIGFHRYLVGQIAASITESPALIAVSCTGPADETGSWLDCGAAVLRCWLAATEHGIALHPISVLVQHDDVRLRLQQQLRLSDRLAFLARAGRPLRQVTGSARRPPTSPLMEL